MLYSFQILEICFIAKKSDRIVVKSSKVFHSLMHVSGKEHGENCDINPKMKQIWTKFAYRFKFSRTLITLILKHDRER